MAVPGPVSGWLSFAAMGLFFGALRPEPLK